MKKIIIILVLALIVIGILGIIYYEKSEKNMSSHTINKDGITIEILTPGNGNETKNGDIVSVHYVGTLEDGKKFDSSIDRGKPFTFTLGAGQVIKGWEIGVLGMKVGEKRKLTIPSELAYGVSGVQGLIPPYSTLVFEVELLNVNNK